MIDAIKIRLLQGKPVIEDVRNAVFPGRYRGLPKIKTAVCSSECKSCVESCPTNAITIDPVRIDLGKCTFCALCAEVCPEEIFEFTADYHLGTSVRENLIINKDTEFIPVEIATEKIRNYFGRSLKLRQISAGGCNGCELELNALSNVNFDLGRYGIEFVASPRHADGVVITGPITNNMANSAQICFDACPDPKIIILVGTCAISGGLFMNSEEVKRKFLEEHSADLYIPGCPPHPLTFINAILDWLDKK